MAPNAQRQPRNKQVATCVFVHFPTFLGERGGGLAQDAITQTVVAQSATQKVSKQAITMLTDIKPHIGDELISTTHKKLGDYFVQVRTTESQLENMTVLGTDHEGKVATCEVVIKVLVSAATLLEQAFHHLKACAGLMRGFKDTA